MAPATELHCEAQSCELRLTSSKTSAHSWWTLKELINLFPSGITMRYTVYTRYIEVLNAGNRLSYKRSFDKTEGHLLFVDRSVDRKSLQVKRD